MKCLKVYQSIFEETSKVVALRNVLKKVQNVPFERNFKANRNIEQNVIAPKLKKAQTKNGY